MNSADNPIKATLILETIGKPKEYLKETLENMSNQIDQQDKVRVTNKDIKEPKEMENSQGFFSTFAEIEVEVEQMLNIAMLMFRFMPSNIEVTEPENITFSNNEWNELFNALTKRLHAYDELSKILQNENSKMRKRLEQLEPGKWAKSGSSEESSKNSQKESESNQN